MEKEKTIDEIIDELTEFYETAGFENYYERVLQNMSEESIREHYQETFKEEDQELIDWERRYKNE